EAAARDQAAADESLDDAAHEGAPEDEAPEDEAAEEDAHVAERAQEQAAGKASEGDAIFGSGEFIAWQDCLHRFRGSAGVVAILDATGGSGGTVHLNGPMRLQPAWLRHVRHVLPPPSFVVASEHYAHLLRLQQSGTRTRLNVALDAETYDDPENAFNVIA